MIKYKHVLALNPNFGSGTTTMAVFPPTGLEYIVASMKDLVGKDQVLGMANVQADLKGTGLSSEKIKQSLTGTAGFEFTDGAAWQWSVIFHCQDLEWGCSSACSHAEFRVEWDAEATREWGIVLSWS